MKWDIVLISTICTTWFYKKWCHQKKTAGGGLAWAVPGWWRWCGRCHTGWGVESRPEWLTSPWHHAYSAVRPPPWLQRERNSRWLRSTSVQKAPSMVWSSRRWRAGGGSVSSSGSFPAAFLSSDFTALNSLFVRFAWCISEAFKHFGQQAAGEDLLPGFYSFRVKRTAWMIHSVTHPVTVFVLFHCQTFLSSYTPTSCQHGAFSQTQDVL